MKFISKRTIITAILTLILLVLSPVFFDAIHVEAAKATTSTSTKKKAAKTKTSTYEMNDTERAYYAELCRNVFHDEVTATAIELNFIQKINQIKASADGSYIVDFKAITGDSSNPMLIFDLYVNNPDIMTLHHGFEVDAYTLGVEVFENELEHYGYNDCMVYQDAQNKGLYHGLMRGAPAWLCGDEEAVIYFNQLKIGYTTLPIDIEYRIKPVSEKYLPTTYKYLARTIPFEGIKFTLDSVECGLYGSDASFSFDFLGQPWANGATDFEQVRSIAEATWENLKACSYFLVDGNPVSIDSSVHEWAYSDSVDKQCHVYMSFYGINFPYAKSVSFVCGGKTIKLK